MSKQQLSNFSPTLFVLQFEVQKLYSSEASLNEDKKSKGKVHPRTSHEASEGGVEL